MSLDHEAPYIFTLEDVICETECEAWIKAIDALEPTTAPITTFRGEVYKTDIRNNERVLKNSPEYAAYLFDKVKERLPADIFGWTIIGLNELFRCYRYKPGMKFLPHTDGCYARSEDERSYYTLLLYLNTVDSGGETAFYVEPEVRISPKPGLALVFQHDIAHEACEVVSGIKYVARTDVMYRRVVK